MALSLEILMELAWSRCDRDQGVRRQKFSEGATFSNGDVTMMS